MTTPESMPPAAVERGDGGVGLLACKMFSLYVARSPKPKSGGSVGGGLKVSREAGMLG